MSYHQFSFLFFFKQKTAYEMRISDWSSDVCSSDLQCGLHRADLLDLTFDLANTHLLPNLIQFTHIDSRKNLAGNFPASQPHCQRNRQTNGNQYDDDHVVEQDRKSVVSGKSV